LYYNLCSAGLPLCMPGMNCVSTSNTNNNMANHTELSIFRITEGVEVAYDVSNDTEFSAGGHSTHRRSFVGNLSTNSPDRHATTRHIVGHSVCLSCTTCTQYLSPPSCYQMQLFRENTQSTASAEKAPDAHIQGHSRSSLLCQSMPHI